MLAELASAWIASLLFIAGYEFLYFYYLRFRPLNELLRFAYYGLLILSSIFYYTASAFAGALTMLYLWPPDTLWAGRIEAFTGILLGIWLLGIFLQIVINAMRKLAGGETQPLVFFNRNAFAFLRRPEKNPDEE